MRRSLLIIIFLGVVNGFLLAGCNYSQPPLEFTPSPKIIEKAIQFELNKRYEKISDQLGINKTKFSIKNINVNKIEPRIKFNLPLYHLEGNCQVIEQKNRSQIRKITHYFQLDLQRQSLGKTWRLIIRDDDRQNIYKSYKM